MTETAQPTQPRKKDSWGPDLVVILQLALAGGGFTALGFALGVNSDFFRGFLTGFGPAAGLVILLMIGFHLIKGRSFIRYKRGDERIRQLATKAAAMSFWLVLFAMAVLNFVIFSEISISIRVLLPAVMAGAALLNLLTFLVLLRRF